MDFLRTPRGKLFVASALLLALAGAASIKGIDAASGARWLLAAAAVAGGLWWWKKGRAGAGKFARPARLSVVSRAGLTQRCGVALVEADGRTYLVVHGDGFADVCEAAQPARALQGRRPTPRRRSRKGGGK